MAGTYNAGSIVYEVDMDTKRLLEARREVDAALNGMGASMGKLEASVSRTERSISSMEGAVSQLTSVAKGLAAALTVHQVVEWGNAWVTVNNKLANSVRSNEQLIDVTQRVFDISQNTMSSLDATATLYGRLERATRSAGTSTQDLITLTSTINKGLAVSGATTEEASSTMTQLSQALASGVLRGEEFNSLSENGSRLAVALANSLGVTIGQLRAMAAQGQLTTDVVVKGLLQQSDVIGKEFANTAVTMGQAFTIATNNITKFVGESSTVSSGIKAFNTNLIMLSQNLGTISTVVVALAAVMGSRFAGALAMATAAKVKDTAATIASNKASAVAAKDAELEAGAKLRLAEVEKAAAIQTLSLAEGRLKTVRATNASVIAEVQLAEAEAASIRTSITLVESEKLLETQRLRSQITDQGRIATATRMAQLQQASAALNARLATAEAATASARATAIAAAESQTSAARIAAANATDVATAANGRYILSQEASAVASRAASASLAVLRGALSLIGGPAGFAMAAAAAVYYFWQKAQQAKQEAIAFADSIDKLNESMKSMSNIQLRGVIGDANTSLRAQGEDVSDLEAKVAKLQRQYASFTPAAQKVAESLGAGADYANRQAIVSDELGRAVRDLQNAKDKYSRTESTAAEATRTLTNNMLTAMGMHDSLIEKGTTLERVQGAVAKAFGNTADEINRANQAGQKFNPNALQVSAPTAKGDAGILDLQEQVELLKIKDERLRAVTQAEMEQRKVTENPNQINKAGQLAGERFDLKKEEDARKKAASEAVSQSKKASNQAERNARVLDEYSQKAALSADSTSDLSREQAILAARQKLTNPTPQQVAQIEADAAAIWDKAAAIKAQATALKLVPEDAENSRYQKEASDLKLALDKKTVTQQQHDAAAEQLEQEHQVNLAKIRAKQNAGVTPLQEAQGAIDPVQQLANENAQKLELIKQFETQKGQITQRGLDLMNAANTKYEQQRITAQWAIFKAQNDSNALLATTIESLSGGATNAITGLLNGTQSLSEAFANLGTAVLNGIVSSLVQMGTQWVMSAVMGQTAQDAATAANQATFTAAIAANQATATAALAASTLAGTAAASTLLASWSPAAMAASIASYGGAATAGLAGYTTAMAAAQTMSIAGAREHGGPVNGSNLYRVGEGGKPEIFKASNGSQYMIPGDNGSVISNKDIGGAGGGGQTVHQMIQVNGNPDDRTLLLIQQAAAQGAKQGYQMVIGDLAGGKGKASKALKSTFTTRNKLT